jgi:hypothetical protein
VAALVLFLHTLWAVVYAELVVDRLPGPVWFRGLVFSLLPLALSAFVLLPVLGAGVLGLRLGVGVLPLLGEVFRNAVFGASLGISYALLRDALAPPPRPAVPGTGGLASEDAPPSTNGVMPRPLSQIGERTRLG